MNRGLVRGFGGPKQLAPTGTPTAGQTARATGPDSAGWVSAGAWFTVAGTGAPAVSLGVDNDYAVNDRSQVYRKTAGAWVVSGRLAGYAATFIAAGWSSSTAPGALVAPQASSSAWTMTNLAAQSGTQITFAGSSANASAVLSLPAQATSVNGYFIVSVLPVGGPVSIGIGVTPGSPPWPLVNISTAGVVTVTTGYGVLLKTMSGSLAAGDGVNISLRPGAVLISTSDVATGLIRDTFLFASEYVNLYNLQSNNSACHILGTGTLTAGTVTYGGRIEVLL